MADPAQQAAGSQPEAGGNNQPKDTPPHLAVIDLTHAGDKKTQYSGGSGVSHYYSSNIQVTGTFSSIEATKNAQTYS
jgi:hypothetical protein